MAGDKGAHTAEQENEPDKRPPWWKRLWARTGFGDKTLWDLLQLLIVPLALAIIGLAFAAWQDARQQAIEEQRTQDLALQAYLDQMSTLVLEDLDDSKVQTLLRARTLTVLDTLDPSRKREVIGFLLEAKLVGTGCVVLTASGESINCGAEVGGAPSIDVISLSGADLRDVDLHRALLMGANLAFADLRGADLRGADLRGAVLGDAKLAGAKLVGADLSGAFLTDAKGVTGEELEQQAKSLEGATMPDGQKYEEWLKSKGSGEENSGPS